MGEWFDVYEGDSERDAEFPHAPSNWRKDAAVHKAREEGLELREDHWDAVRALQEYYNRNIDGGVNMRELHDALDERFFRKGGIKYLYQLFPGGPIAQGCRISGLQAPAGAIDYGFGSVA